MTKILALAGSYRKGGIVDQAIDVAVQKASRRGAEIDVVQLRDFPIDFCAPRRGYRRDSQRRPKNVIAAAWLHDVVEDTPTTIEDVGRAFGTGVRDLVDALTDVSRPHHGNRAARKALDREHLAKAPAGGQTVKLADLIDNCDDICRHSPGFGRVFLSEMGGLLDVLDKANPELMARARRLHDHWTKRLKPRRRPK